MENQLNKILFVIPKLSSGGGNRVLLQLANKLSKNNKVKIISLSKKKNNFYKLNKSIEILHIGISFFNIYILNIALLYFALYVYQFKYKIIFSDPITSLLIIFLPKRNLNRYIQSNDYEIFDENKISRIKFILAFYKYMTLISYKKKINYIFGSTFCYETFLRISGRNVKKKIVFPSIDKNFYEKKKSLHYKIKKKVNISLMPRKQKFKGDHIFFKAWKMFINKDAINKIYLISGEKVNLPSLDKFIHIKPHSDSEIAKILNNTDIFISTSYFDGFGLPPLEALYCGCIVLIPNIKSNLDFSNKQRKIIKYRMKNHLDLNKNLNLIIKNIDFYKSQKKLIINKKNFSEDYNSKKFLKFLK